MISSRNVELPPDYGHWWSKPVLSYSKPHIYSTFLEKENSLPICVYPIVVK